MVEVVKLFLICVVALAATNFVTASPTIKWIEQKLDHFNKRDTRTWKMQYTVIEDFIDETNPGSPLFIYVGGCREVSGISESLFEGTARDRFARLFKTCHRYVDDSRTIANLTTESQKYLNVQQVLADLAHFIRTIKSSSPNLNNAKVILHGKSYDGSLATWFKILYPDLADGVWASGAPLLAKLECNELTEAVGKRIRTFGGDSCYNQLANGIKKMEQMLAENRSAELKTTFNLCDTFNASNELDVANLFYNLFLQINVYTTSINSINDTCEKLMHDDLKGLSYILSPYAYERCRNYTYKREVTRSNADPWLYLSCNELGWFPTTNSTQQPFGTKVPLSFFNNLCKDAFGDKFTPEYMESQINKTNQLFGGLNPQVENVFFTYGEFNSWLPLGMQDAKKAAIIPREIIWSDLNSLIETENEDINAVKFKLWRLINEWLNGD